MNHSTPGLPVHHQLLEFTQTHVHRVGDAIQPSHPLSSPSLPAPNPSQHQSLFQWVNSSHEVAKVLEFHVLPGAGISLFLPFCTFFVSNPFSPFLVLSFHYSGLVWKFLISLASFPCDLMVYFFWLFSMISKAQRVRHLFLQMGP